ncbi:HipA domain-containing protein [Kordia sp.]|uniref:HipA domain-containing protein n=1 Tax=Kordia sp. TaxID=1965332 RepID=UPI003D29ABFD
MSKQLTSKKCIHKSGIFSKLSGLDILKQQNFKCINESVGGDAPKDVIRVYEYKKCLKVNPKKWIKYIAKIGHKWYPNESITEQFMTEIGTCFGINIANSRLVYVENYIRFLSEHFHNEEQSLEHGANILSRYLNETNTEWIDDMDKDRSLKSYINIDDITRAIKEVFKKDHQTILDSFFHMLLFDALSGNNDRHYYNWGVITHIKNKHNPKFSPIYDSARGLYWNKSDEKMLDLYSELKLGNNKSLNKYVKNSSPKISIPNNKSCNHFDLVDYLIKNNYISNNHKEIWTNEESLDKAILILNTKFQNFFLKERREIIEKILKIRFEKLSQLLDSVK